VGSMITVRRIGYRDLRLAFKARLAQAAKAEGRNPSPTMIARSMITAALACVVMAAAAAADPTDALVNWAENAKPSAAYHLPPAITTAVHDWFASVPASGMRDKWGLGMGGLDLPTAGGGSTWVYDSVSHIAASTFYGEESGSQIFYAGAPPSAIVSKDLSGVHSVHGLMLGISMPQAARDLGVPASKVHRIDAHYSVLSVINPFKCGIATCGHFAVVVFRDGRAVYISLAEGM
jgi:hypothetical protein